MSLRCPKCGADVSRVFASAGGKAGTGAAKARTSEQARAAINARWAKRKTKKRQRQNELLEARRRYSNARRRARYWSGMPERKRSLKTQSSILWEKYELAMADCHNWELTLSEMTGKKLKHYDPRRDFQNKFPTAWAKALNASNNRDMARGEAPLPSSPGSDSAGKET